MGKSVPATPDYVGAAQATGQASAQTTAEQTYANRPDVNTPWSQQTWSSTPTWDPSSDSYVDSWTENTNLVPQAQNALNNELGTAQNLSSTADTLTQQANQELTQPINWSNYTPLASTPQSADAYANQAGNAAYQQYINRNQPLQQIALNQQQTQLENQGLKPGDQAYDTAMLNLQNQQSDANTQASLGATQFGVQGGATMQSENLAAGNFQDQTRQQQIAQDLEQRGFTTNEIMSLLTGQQVSTGPSPNFNAASSATPTNYSSALQNLYGANLNASNLQNSQTSNGIGDAIGLIGAFA